MVARPLWNSDLASRSSDSEPAGASEAGPTGNTVCHGLTNRNEDEVVSRFDDDASGPRGSHGPAALRLAGLVFFRVCGLGSLETL
jgi:hypothetical protein